MTQLSPFHASRDNPAIASHIQGWLSHLSRLLPAREGRITQEVLAMYTEFLLRDIPVSAFSMESLHEVLKELRFWPSYAELHSVLRQYCIKKELSFFQPSGKKPLENSLYLPCADKVKQEMIRQKQDKLWDYIEKWLVWFIGREDRSWVFYASGKSSGKNNEEEDTDIDTNTTIEKGSLKEREEEKGIPLGDFSLLHHEWSAISSSSAYREWEKLLDTLYDLCPVAWNIVISTCQSYQEGCQADVRQKELKKRLGYAAQKQVDRKG